MKSSDIYYSILIFIIFGIGFSYNKLEEVKVDFKKDWPDNRCNPFYMPFAKMADADPADNFADCIGDMQFNMMPDFLGPITGVLDTMNSLAANTGGSMGGIFGAFDYIRDKVAGIFGAIMGIFGGVIITFQFMLITMRAIMMKMYASTKTMYYSLRTAAIMMSSLQKTAFYKSVKSLASMVGAG